MTGNPHDPVRPKHFRPLEQAAFRRLEHAAYLKGLLQPFKGKGSLEIWANQCRTLRDAMMGLAEHKILPQARTYPFSLLPVQLAQQPTGAGTTFLRWRNPDRSSMGVALWQQVMLNPSTPVTLMDDLYAIEQQRIVLNMQISLLHTLARQTNDCANKMADAENVWLRRMAGAAS